MIREKYIKWELLSLTDSIDWIVKSICWVGRAVCMRDMRSAHKISPQIRSEETRTRRTQAQMNDIKMDLKNRVFALGLGFFFCSGTGLLFSQEGIYCMETQKVC